MTATATATSTGWVIEVVSGVHCDELGRTFYSKGDTYGTLWLEDAHTYETRKEARDLKFEDGTEVVRKVELDDRGRATHIIPGR